MQATGIYTDVFVTGATGIFDNHNLFERHAVANLLVPLHSWQTRCEHAFMFSVLIEVMIPMASQKAV